MTGDGPGVLVCGLFENAISLQPITPLEELRSMREAGEERRGRLGICASPPGDTEGAVA